MGKLCFWRWIPCAKFHIKLLYEDPRLTMTSLSLVKYYSLINTDMRDAMELFERVALVWWPSAWRSQATLKQLLTKVSWGCCSHPFKQCIMCVSEKFLWMTSSSLNLLSSIRFSKRISPHLEGDGLGITWSRMEEFRLAENWSPCNRHDIKSLAAQFR